MPHKQKDSGFVCIHSFSPVLRVFLSLLKHSRIVIILLAGDLVSNKAEHLTRLLGFCSSFVYIFLCVREVLLVPASSYLNDLMTNVMNLEFYLNVLESS